MKKCAWRSIRRRSLTALTLLTVLTIFVGCDRLDMYDQPRYKPLAESDFFRRRTLRAAARRRDGRTRRASR